MAKTPRQWLVWAVEESSSRGRTHAPPLLYEGRGDRRLSSRWETAITVLLLAERASHRVCGNGFGYRMLTDFYVGGKDWLSFSPREQKIVARTAADFARRLQEVGFAERKVRL